MADASSTNLQLLLMEVAGHENDWGDETNENLEDIDAKFGDTTAISTTGGDTDLSDAQELAAALSVTGTLASNATLTFSGRGGFWIIKNGTSGSFTLTALVSGQTGVVIPQGKTLLVWCDGTDIALADDPYDGFASGTSMLFMNSAAPTGWTKSTTHNDKALRIVSGTPSSGGSADFTTVFGKTATDGHTLTTSEMPSHTHDDHYTIPSAGTSFSAQAGAGGAVLASVSYYGTSSPSGSAGGGGSHSHNIDLRVKYVDAIICTKD